MSSGVDSNTFLEMMNRQSQLFQSWAHAVIELAENLPSADAATKEAWRRQAQTAVDALQAHEQMMTQIMEKIAVAAGPDKVAIETMLAAAAPIMDEFMKTWGPQLKAMQDLVATWSSKKKLVPNDRALHFIAQYMKREIDTLKDQPLGVRLAPDVRKAGAADDNRNLGPLMETLLIEHLRANGHLPSGGRPNVKRK